MLMPNQDVHAVLYYHEATDHSPQSVRTSGHYLDWANRPLPFKVYLDLDPIPLPRDWSVSHTSALDAIAPVAPSETETHIPNLSTLASILFHSAGVTRRRSYAGGEIYFRAAACTGALYEIDLYVVCGELPDLDAGVYHFDPRDFVLRKLRHGDLRSVLSYATANHSAVTHAPVTIVCTGTYWRNAWKYQARTYRHFFWDNGTLLANLFAAGGAFGLVPQLVMGFMDDGVNHLLGLNTQQEVALSLVALGHESVAVPANSAHVQSIEHRVGPYSHFEIDYPLMRQIHEASCLVDSKEVEEWRGSHPNILESAPVGRVVDLNVSPELELPRDTIEEVIIRRGSTRQFAQLAITFQQLSTVLDQATRGISADFLMPLGTRLNDLYLIINAVEGLPSGAYYLRRDRLSLEMLREGSFRQQAGHLGLDQSLPADASVAVFFMANLRPILERFGNRGYRAVQMEAGLIGGKIYLGAYALRLGATGLTFYDNEVTDFFSPHAAGKSAIFLTAVGISAKRPLRVA